MKTELLLNDATPREILETVVNEQISAIMSYLSNGRWHVAKIFLTRLGASRFEACLAGRGGKRRLPLNIREGQPVGFSIKYAYGKFVFEANVLGLYPSDSDDNGGIIAFSVPDRIEIIQRRSYYRVRVPESLQVNTVYWHRYTGSDSRNKSKYFQGRLIDISAGGIQMAGDLVEDLDFKVGQFITLRFTPLPYEQPLLLNAQIRNCLPTADESQMCFGLQIVGLEASEEGRETLKRLCDVVEKYYQLHRSNVREMDMETTRE